MQGREADDDGWGKTEDGRQKTEDSERINRKERKEHKEAHGKRGAS